MNACMHLPSVVCPNCAPARTPALCSNRCCFCSGNCRGQQRPTTWTFTMPLSNGTNR